MFPVLFALGVITVSFAFRTDKCTKEHEEFSLCSWQCPPTCVNMRLLSHPKVHCPYRWECRVGCRCSAGYIRDEYSKNCIEVTKCPSGPGGSALIVQSPPGEVPRSCPPFPTCKQ